MTAPRVFLAPDEAGAAHSLLFWSRIVPPETLQVLSELPEWPKEEVTGRTVEDATLAAQVGDAVTTHLPGVALERGEARPLVTFGCSRREIPWHRDNPHGGCLAPRALPRRRGRHRLRIGRRPVEVPGGAGSVLLFSLVPRLLHRGADQRGCEKRTIGLRFAQAKLW